MKVLSTIILILFASSVFATNWNPPTPPQQNPTQQQEQSQNAVGLAMQGQIASSDVNANAKNYNKVNTDVNSVGLGVGKGGDGGDGGNANSASFSKGGNADSNSASFSKGGEAKAYGGKAYSDTDVDVSNKQYNNTSDYNKVDNTDVNANFVKTNTTDVNVNEGSKSSSNSAVVGAGNSSNKNYVGDSKSNSYSKVNSANFVDGNDITIDGPDVAGSTQHQQSDANASADNSGNNTGNADVNVDSSDHSVTTFEAADIPVNSAATTFASICTAGASNQKNTYGISLAVNDIVCTDLMMADAYMALGKSEEALKWVKAAGRHAKTKGVGRYVLHIVSLGIF